MNHTMGVLLAGGESRRFGRPKAFAKFNGKTFWEHAIQVLEETTERQLIISHRGLLRQFETESSHKVITDDPKVEGKGPLAGIYSAMNNEKAEWFVFLSCDIPLISAEIIQKLFTFIDHEKKIIIPKIEGKYQPLVGIYHHSVFPLVEAQLIKNERKMINFIDQVDVSFVTEKELQVNPLVFSNINSPKDYGNLLNNGKISESK